MSGCGDKSLWKQLVLKGVWREKNLFQFLIIKGCGTHSIDICSMWGISLEPYYFKGYYFVDENTTPRGTLLVPFLWVNTSTIECETYSLHAWLFWLCVTVHTAYACVDSFFQYHLWHLCVPCQSALCSPWIPTQQYYGISNLECMKCFLGNEKAEVLSEIMFPSFCLIPNMDHDDLFFTLLFMSYAPQ